MEYKHWEVEKKWLDYWAKNKIYQVKIEPEKPKFYVLDMFPYPSGSGLHVGHPLGYIASDILSRYKRMSGFNVLHPMGFDAFGLPAEQYAIQTGQHPADTTMKNIKRYKEQLENIGFSFDWSRELITSNPKYYKWTQWIFMQFYNSWYDKNEDKAKPISELIKNFETKGNLKVQAAHNCDFEFHAATWNSLDEKEQHLILMKYRLAYLDDAQVNWCAELGTVLANDEVINGVSVRGGHPVEKRPMRQWFLRITAYAERLLEGLNRIDFPESLKEMQRNWIGRSEGATIFFRLQNILENHFSSVEVFTTRPDTIFGATFMVLAPEHELVQKITTPEQKKEIETYIQFVKSRSERERQAEKIVSGAFTGAYAIHPITQALLPIWISEYVLIAYGTGAIMAVPSDDERDAAFAQKFNLPIVSVIDNSDGVPRLINSDFLNGLDIASAKNKIIDFLKQQEQGHPKTSYRMRDAGFSRQRYWGEPFPIVYKNDVSRLLKEEELPLTLPQVSSYKSNGTGTSPLATVKDWVLLPDGSLRETDTMPGYAGSSWYFLRFMDPHNENEFVSKQAQSYWKDVDVYIGGAEHAVGHLLYARFWHKFFYDMKWVEGDEPFKKLINQGMIQGRSNLVHKIKGENKFVSFGIHETYLTDPIHTDVYIVDQHDVLDIEKFCVMYPEYKDAAFIKDPDGNFYCGWEIEKMSKSKYNVVNPDDIIDQYGADTFRMYEMFLGPIEQSKPWNTQGIDGVARFVKKLWRLFYHEQTPIALSHDRPNDAQQKIIHKAIKKITEDIERYSFNTCISTLMITVNELKDAQCNHVATLKLLVLLLAPFAPFISEELWQSVLKQSGSVHLQKFPTYQAEYVQENVFEYPISVNGKLRTKIIMEVKWERPEVEKIVLENEVIQKWLAGQAPKKIIFVPGRMVNVVV